MMNKGIQAPQLLHIGFLKCFKIVGSLESPTIYSHYKDNKIKIPPKADMKIYDRSNETVK